MMSFFKIPKEVLKKLDFYRSQFFGTVMNIKKVTDLLSGAYCANPVV